MRRISLMVLTSVALSLTTPAPTTAQMFVRAGAGDSPENADCYRTGFPILSCTAKGPNGAVQGAFAAYDASTLTFVASSSSSGQWPSGTAQGLGLFHGGELLVNNSDPGTRPAGAYVFRFAASEFGSNARGLFYFGTGVGSVFYQDDVSFGVAADGTTSVDLPADATATDDGFTFTVWHPFTEFDFGWGGNVIAQGTGSISLWAQLLGIDVLDANGNVYQSFNTAQLASIGPYIPVEEPPSTVPEPTSTALLGTGLVSLVFFTTRRDGLRGGGAA